MSNYLAFDLGASSGRAIIGTLENGKLSLTEIHRFQNGPIQKENSLFWDFDALANEIKEGLKKAVSSGREISGIGIDTWGVDYVLLKKDGNIARFPYHYRDSRTDDVPDRLHQIIPFEGIYAKTGIQFMQLNTIYQLFAHKEDHPEDFENSKLLMMPDALTYFLSGKAECEYSEASTSQLLDAVKKTWDVELIEKIGIPTSILPQIAPPCSSAGNLKEEIQSELDCGPIPVYHIGSHDTASAVASVPAEKGKTWAYVSCGTWALLGAELDNPVLTEEARKANFTNEGGLNGKIRFLTNIMGMWLVQECMRVWKEKGCERSFDQIREMVLKAEPLKFIVNPNNQKFFAPGDMPANIKEYCRETGQGKPEDDAAVLRCIYDSLALCFRNKIEDLQQLLKVKYDVLNIVGGGTQAKFFMQLVADCIGFPVISGPVEATAAGNIVGQAMAAGEISSLESAREIIKNSLDVEEIQPDSALKDKWDAASAKFATLE